MSRPPLPNELPPVDDRRRRTGARAANRVAHASRPQRRVQDRLDVHVIEQELALGEADVASEVSEELDRRARERARWVGAPDELAGPEVYTRLLDEVRADLALLDDHPLLHDRRQVLLDEAAEYARLHGMAVERYLMGADPPTGW